METTDYEKLGSFYLGKEYDMDQTKLTDRLLLYDARDLTTHGICVGMTGSGKTGLCIDLLEEAAVDGIPALIIDPKGDITNLLLQFPDLKAEDFQPWINPDDARRKGLTRRSVCPAAGGALAYRAGAVGTESGTDRQAEGICRFCDLYPGQRCRNPDLHPQLICRPGPFLGGGR